MRKNLKKIQSNKKLDYKKIDFFVIKIRKSNINYKLELSKGINIYLIFNVSLLESTNLKTSIIIQKLLKLS